MRNKRGDLGKNLIVALILMAVIITVFFIVYNIVTKKDVGMLEFIKNLLRFR